MKRIQAKHRLKSKATSTRRASIFSFCSSKCSASSIFEILSNTFVVALTGRTLDRNLNRFIVLSSTSIINILGSTYINLFHISLAERETLFIPEVFLLLQIDCNIAMRILSRFRVQSSEFRVSKFQNPARQSTDIHIQMEL